MANCHPQPNMWGEERFYRLQKGQMKLTLAELSYSWT